MARSLSALVFNLTALWAIGADLKSKLIAACLEYSLRCGAMLWRTGRGLVFLANETEERHRIIALACIHELFQGRTWHAIRGFRNQARNMDIADPFSPESSRIETLTRWRGPYWVVLVSGGLTSLTRAITSNTCPSGHFNKVL